MRTICLPDSLCADVEERWRSRFSSIDDLLIFILQELNDSDVKKLDQAEEQAVEQRLRDLGYI